MKKCGSPAFVALSLALVWGLASCSSPGTAPGQPKEAGENARAGDDVVRPFKNKNGRPFRVAVIQSGDYFAYNDVLVSIRDGLAELGWVGKVDLSPEVKASVPLILKAWNQVATTGMFNRKSSASATGTLPTPNRGPQYITFPPESFIDLNWTEDPNPPPALRALRGGERDVDMVISLGTLAGTFVSKVAQAGKLKVPVMIESVSDPLGAKIIPSLTDSGNDLVSASFDPGAYARQVRMFHQVTGVRRLGLIYTDTETGRSYAALDKVTAASKDLGFTIVPNTDVLEDPPDPKDIPKAEAAYVRAMEAIGSKVDAVYLAIQAGLTKDSLPAIIAMAERHRLPTFIMEGADFVWRGALLGESNTLQTIEGLYSARKLTRILAGTPPRLLPQSNPHVPHIAINLAEARKLGFDIPVDVLLSADDVFTTIMVDSPEVKK
jgi:ABC-type uncharacterized transport system substrate-binding protein